MSVNTFVLAIAEQLTGQSIVFTCHHNPREVVSERSSGTPLRVRLGSMVSYQATGKLFDGNGIDPDVLIDPVPEYFIGVRDNQIEEAIKQIKQISAKR
ncbi:MAG TPA: hypothetical protein VF074_21915 [Pyrinomonadaceae bacterium]